MSEPKTRLEALEYVLSQAGIEKKDQGPYKSIGSLRRLVATPDATLEGMAANDTDYELLLAIKMWIQDYLTNNNNDLPLSWLSTFTEKIFTGYIISKNAAPTTAAAPTTSASAPVPTSATLKVSAQLKVGEYPKWNGKDEGWPMFKEVFQGIAMTQDVYEVLEKYDASNPIPTDDEFKSKSKFIYGVLKAVCAEGIAKTKVKKYEAQLDGNAAWNDMATFYDNAGTKRNSCCIDQCQIVEFVSGPQHERWIRMVC